MTTLLFPTFNTTDLVKYHKASSPLVSIVDAATIRAKPPGIPQSVVDSNTTTTLGRWGCPPSRFPWSYTAKETCFLLKGKVKVYPEGHNGYVEFGAGDLVEFPKGLNCTWDVSEAVDKHYNFE